MNETISWEDFSKIDMRVGTIIDVTDFPEARNPAYQVTIDFGSDLGRQIIAVVNFPKKQIANFMSECLILGAVAGKDVVLLKPESSVPDGLKIS